MENTIKENIYKNIYKKNVIFTTSFEDNRAKRAKRGNSLT